MLSIQANTAAILPFLERSGSQAQKWARMAGSSAVRAMRSEASRQIRSVWNIKLARVNKSLTTTFPGGSGELVWSVRSSYGPTPLADFGARQTKAGVSVLIKRSGGRVTIRGAFLARMDSGHLGVFKRRTKKRLPIGERFGPAVANAFRDAAPAIAKRGEEVFLVTFERLVTRG